MAGPSSTSAASTSATAICAVIAIDHENLYYRACSVCERTLPDSPDSLCRFCTSYNRITPSSSSSSRPPSKRLFRLLVSIATDTKVRNVMCFDRAARVLLGCSADEFCDFAKLHRFAGACAGKVLEGEMFNVTLTKPKNGNAQHLRVSSIVPLRTGFQPAIKTLRSMLRSSS